MVIGILAEATCRTLVEQADTTIPTVKAVIDKDGNVRPPERVRPRAARCALVTILEEGPATQVSESAVLK
jgi:hypothetical protein